MLWPAVVIHILLLTFGQVSPGTPDAFTVAIAVILSGVGTEGELHRA